MAKQPKELIRVEEVTYGYGKHKETAKVLIYEDQPNQLTEESAKKIFEQYPECNAIHELHEVWGGRWSKSIYKSDKS
jgi:hypothetical protein